jgi:hypothetical protein
MHSSQSSGLEHAHANKLAGLSSQMRNSSIAIGDAAPPMHLAHNCLRSTYRQPRTYRHRPSSLLALLRAPATLIFNTRRCRNYLDFQVKCTATPPLQTAISPLHTSPNTFSAYKIDRHALNLHRSSTCSRTWLPCTAPRAAVLNTRTPTN